MKKKIKMALRLIKFIKKIYLIFKKLNKTKPIKILLALKQIIFKEIIRKSEWLKTNSKTKSTYFGIKKNLKLTNLQSQKSKHKKMKIINKKVKNYFLN